MPAASPAAHPLHCLSCRSAATARPHMCMPAALPAEHPLHCCPCRMQRTPGRKPLRVAGLQSHVPGGGGGAAGAAARPAGSAACGAGHAALLTCCAPPWLPGTTTVRGVSTNWLCPALVCAQDCPYPFYVASSKAASRLAVLLGEGAGLPELGVEGSPRVLASLLPPNTKKAEALRLVVHARRSSRCITGGVGLGVWRLMVPVFAQPAHAPAPQPAPQAHPAEASQVAFNAAAPPSPTHPRPQAHAHKPRRTAATPPSRPVSPRQCATPSPCPAEW